MIPEPIAPDHIAPNPGAIKLRAIGTIIGAAFFKTLPTLLTTLLTDLNNFLKKNSGNPVVGFKLFLDSPTTYRSGSSTPSSLR